MTPKLFYIHGLGSDANSRKYLNLKEYFKEQFRFDCLEWKNNSDISQLLDEAEKMLESEDKVILFGDSTGANFACQLREKRKQKNLKTILILSSPLLDESRRIADFPFPGQLKVFLKKIENPENTLIIVPLHDEVIDHSFLLKNNLSETKILKVDDSHRLPKFKEYLPKIESYIQAELQV